MEVQRVPLETSRGVLAERDVGTCAEQLMQSTRAKTLVQRNLHRAMRAELAARSNLRGAFAQDNFAEVFASYATLITFSTDDEVALTRLGCQDEPQALLAGSARRQSSHFKRSAARTPLCECATEQRARVETGGACRFYVAQ